jgi:hypothetical protein
MGKPVVRTALDLPVLDVGGFYTSSQVEGALQELGGGGGGGGASFAQVDLPVLVNGQTAFTLPVAYVGVGGLFVLHVNGVVYIKDDDFGVSGAPLVDLVWNDVLFTLETTDCVTAYYQTV